ncbi:Rieske (2Fe-2S) protein [Pleomorphovibrio marinus]|uniref:Rieske (2Fe-2S) protein n=1 Tax=Pleomorphovibrio marinus TaxID=2164132 RepID=UPI000E0C57C5|nr:Rieske 2Fe-2S domain-containing protein [Pleomorphovibrio marinus]
MRTFTLGRSQEEAISLFPDRSIREVQLGDQKICVARDGESFFAFERLCPHRLANLKEGQLNSFQEVICPLHHYRFELNSGRVASGDCRDLKVYKAELDESGLKISI